MFRNFFDNSILIPFAFIFMLLSLYAVLIQPPRAFPVGATVTVPVGTPIDEVAETLGKMHAIRSPIVFSLFVRIANSDAGVLAHTYSLGNPENVLTLAHRFANGVTGIEPVRITIQEGLNSREIGLLLRDKLEGFDSERFTLLAKDNEGYLFPDTYYFLPDASPEAVVETMRANFNARVAPLETEIRSSGKSIHEIITMASLLEKEARRAETKSVVAGILWKRIEIGMPLQVDAVFGYILNKSGYAPNFDDLKVESPYNTYLNRGLPPTPIASAGLVSIEAALRPTETDYLYYLTGADGLMYYSKTFEGHKVNRTHLE